MLLTWREVSLLVESVKLPLFNDLLPAGLRFGANYLVEFEPHSLWHEASLSLCVQALRQGIRTDYHTFTHAPDDVRRQLAALDHRIVELEAHDTFRIWDSYTTQTSYGGPLDPGRTTPGELRDNSSLKMSDWEQLESEELAEGYDDADRGRLHIDDNTSVLVQFNDEKSVFEHHRTRTAPYVRKLGLSALHSVVRGAYSDSFYSQFEAFCDGIIDFKAQEEGGRIEQYLRIRACRGETFDSRWHRIRLSPTGEVVFAGLSYGL